MIGKLRAFLGAHASTVRAIEGFGFVVVLGFLSQFSIAGAPIDLSTHDSQAVVLSAIGSAFALAVRHAWATRGTSS